MTYDGYDGGDSEQELIKAANEILSLGEADTVSKIKRHYWLLGSIIETAIARGYTKPPGMKGWVNSWLRCSHTHAYDCLNAWKNRHDFDEAYRWYQSLNSKWHPNKMTGPRFALEIIKAWRDRHRTDAEKLASTTRKKQTHAKDAIDAAKKWKARYERLRDEHRKLAQFADREPLVLQAIEREIADEGVGSSATSLASQPGLTPASEAPGLPEDTEQLGKSTGSTVEPDDGLAAHVAGGAEPDPGKPEPKRTRRPRKARSQDIAAIETNKEPASGSDLTWSDTETAGQMAQRLAQAGMSNEAVGVEANHAD